MADPLVPVCMPSISLNRLASFQLRVGNYPHLLAAYGERIAQGAVAALRDYLAGIVQDHGAVEALAEDILQIGLWRAGVAGEGLKEADCVDWLKVVCEKIPLIPFESEMGPLHLWISGLCALPGGDGAGDAVGEWVFPFVGGMPCGEAWAERYRADMALASRALVALAEPLDDVFGARNTLRSFWQPVWSADRGEVLYYEALARLFYHDGLPESPGSCLLSMERLGFVRLFDLHMVRQVIAELERSPGVHLAVNLSALSLCDDPWWEDVMAELSAKGDVAKRLLLEITETASVPNISDAIRFVTGMRRLGCRIVIDDFGTGFASVRQLLAFLPEVVKIDRVFLRRATVSARDRALFERLAQLARSIGSVVIAEGVETPRQKRIAQDAGVDWQQGYLWGRPSYCRTWPGGSSFEGAAGEEWAKQSRLSDLPDPGLSLGGA